jgi:O-antigen ligase
MIQGNPLFGVGPGEFKDYRFSVLKKRYFPSHNTYAQIAAESGIPGLLFYLAFLACIYRTLLRIKKRVRATRYPETQLLLQITLCLEVTLGFFIMFSFFLTCDRYPHPFVIAGLALALERLLEQWISRQPPSVSPVSQARTVFQTFSSSAPLLRH